MLTLYNGRPEDETGRQALSHEGFIPSAGIARLFFAKENYMEEFLYITPGSVSVMGLMNDHGNRGRRLSEITFHM